MENTNTTFLDSVKTLCISIVSLITVDALPLFTKGNVTFSLQVVISLLTILYLIVKNYKQIKK